MHFIHTIVSTHMSSKDDSIPSYTNSIIFDTNGSVCSISDNVLHVSGNLFASKGYAESGD